MRKTLFASAAVAALVLPATGHAQSAPAASPHTFTGNLTLASEYLYRGIAQTRGRPALQGGFDYAHASGLYAGLWGSNISWINDGTPGASASPSWTSMAATRAPSRATWASTSAC